MPVRADLREQVESRLTSLPDVTPRNMMGTTAYMVRGRMFAFWVADGLVAKLSDRTRQEFLDRKLGVLFQGPQGRGFGEWTRLPITKKADLDHVLDAATQAHEYVRGTAGTKPKRRKSKR